MNERPKTNRAEESEANLGAFACAAGQRGEPEVFAKSLERFFAELPAIPLFQAEFAPQTPKHCEVTQFFADLSPPLEEVRSRGGLVNIWELAGLKYNEVRTTAALAGLWRTDFGGQISLSFLAQYLRLVVKRVNWQQELASGYGVFTEVNPLGDLSDRVDLVIQTQGYLIGIEVKIGAKLGFEQLERYSYSLETRARQIHKKPLLIFLARNRVNKDGVHYSSWRDVAAAAKEVTKTQGNSRKLVHHVIAQFGDYVSQQ